MDGGEGCETVTHTVKKTHPETVLTEILGLSYSLLKTPLLEPAFTEQARLIVSLQTADPPSFM